MVRHLKLLSVFALVAFSLAAGMLIGSGFRLPIGTAPGEASRDAGASASWPPPATALAATADAIPGSFADIVERVNPAVVFVQVTEVGRRSPRGQRPPMGVPEDFWEFFQREHPRGDDGDDGMFRREGGGSGFIIDKDGYILTNNHVVSGATKVTVKLADDREFEAEVKGTDDLLDVALLKINPSEDLPVVPLGDSERLRVGDWVMAIGNPFVYEHTVTVGVVSHKGRSSGNPFQQFIQTDAAINFGNSGGPLLNTSAEVVGINTAISAVGQGIGFAIPINRVRDIMAQLKDTGKVSRGFLGVNPQEIDEKLLKAFPGLPGRDGALVVEVEKGSPAAKAGVMVDDVIVELAGQAIRSRDDLFRAVGSTAPGTRVDLKILREEKKGSGRWETRSLDVTLAERPAERTAEADPRPRDPGQEQPGKRLGMRVEELDREARGRLRIGDGVRGVLVVDVSASGSAADAGIAEGDVISEVNGVPVNDLAELASALEGLKPGSLARLRIYHQGSPRYVPVTVGE